MARSTRGPRSRIGRVPSTFRRRAIPVMATMIGSLTPLLPVIATTPLMPPVGLLVMLCWRAQYRHVWPLWAAVVLGAWDDMFSGAPIGTAMLLWTLALLAFDVIDRQMVWREFREDWQIIALITTLAVIAAALFSAPAGYSVPAAILLPQIIVTILAVPIVSRICSKLDEWRFS